MGETKNGMSRINAQEQNIDFEEEKTIQNKLIKILEINLRNKDVIKSKQQKE